MTASAAAEPGAGGPTALPVATPRRTWRLVGGLLREHRALAAGGFVASLAAAVLGVSVPYLLGVLVDQIDRHHSGRGVVTVLLGLLVAAALGAVATAASYRLVITLSTLLLASLREQVVARALTMEAATLESAGTGDVAARVSGDVEVVSESAQTIVLLVSSVFTVVVSAVAFATLDWRLALAFFTVFAVYVPSLRWYVPTSARRYAVERAASARRTQTVLTAVNGAATIHAYGMEGRQSATMAGASRRWVDAAMDALRALQTFANTMNFAEAVGLGAVLLTGFWLVRDGAVSVGAVTAAALMFHRLFSPLGFLLFSFDDVQAAGAALARLVGVADLPAPAQPDGPSVAAPGGSRGAVNVSVRGVAHRYRPGRPVLDGVDLDVPAGTRLAMVGASGAGKTTLAAIVAGVFPATAGEVRLGGAPVGALPAPVLRHTVGVVTQEVHVFSGTLRDDLRLADPEADDGRLRDALSRIGAEGWLAALPDGLDTAVGDGGLALTAAQAQQLALTRLLLTDPAVVVLDEAAAEAGSSGARLLEESARALTAGRTAIVVAHRLSQAAECEQIVVLDAGRVVERGTHDELRAAGGPYARLWAAWRPA